MDLKIDVNLEMISIDEAVLIDDMAARDASGKPLNKDIRLGQLVDILDRAITVEGFESVRKLPVPALRQLMQALSTEMGNMGDDPSQGNPTTA